MTSFSPGSVSVGADSGLNGTETVVYAGTSLTGRRGRLFAHTGRRATFGPGLGDSAVRGGAITAFYFQDFPADSFGCPEYVITLPVSGDGSSSSHPICSPSLVSSQPASLHQPGPAGRCWAGESGCLASALAWVGTL